MIKVTKKFYGEFEKQRKAFAAFIEGIPADSEDQRWYTAVVIDRLMFLWFLPSFFSVGIRRSEKPNSVGKKPLEETKLSPRK